MTTHDRQRRRFLIQAGMGTIATTLAHPILANTPAYPNRPIRFIVPFAPGGGTDLIGRAFARKMGETINGNIVVENIPGAGGTIGSERVARAAADGYTILLSNVASHAIAPGLPQKLRYDPVQDFEHIALFGSFPNALLVPPNFPANNLAEFVRKIKASTSPVTYASAGMGSSPHLCGELFKLRTGIDALHVPYKGSAPARIAFIRGDTTFQFENFVTALAMINNGEAKALAVTSELRPIAMPDLPTMQEGGVPNFVIASWYGLSAPANTPMEIRKLLADAAVKAQADQEIQALMTRIGVTPATVQPEGYREFVRKEVAKMQDIISKADIKAD